MNFSSSPTSSTAASEGRPSYTFGPYANTFTPEPLTSYSSAPSSSASSRTAPPYVQPPSFDDYMSSRTAPPYVPPPSFDDYMASQPSKSSSRPSILGSIAGFLTGSASTPSSSSSSYDQPPSCPDDEDFDRICQNLYPGDTEYSQALRLAKESEYRELTNDEKRLIKKNMTKVHPDRIREGHPLAKYKACGSHAVGRCAQMLTQK